MKNIGKRSLALLLTVLMCCQCGGVLELAALAADESAPVVEEVVEPVAEVIRLDAPAEEAPAEETPAEETPAEETPAEETPAEETPAEEAPAEETPAKEEPAKEEPAKEEPAEETPAEEKDDSAAAKPLYTSQKVALAPEGAAASYSKKMVADSEHIPFVTNSDEGVVTAAVSYDKTKAGELIDGTVTLTPVAEGEATVIFFYYTVAEGEWIQNAETYTVTVKAATEEAAVPAEAPAKAPAKAPAATVPATQVQMSGNDSIYVKGSTVLTATVSPEDTTDEIIWEITSNSGDKAVEEIADITESADKKSLTIVGVSDGQLTVKAMAGTQMAQKSINVNYAYPTGVSISAEKTTLAVEETLKLTAEVAPEGAVQTVTWTSSDENVLTVAEDGTVTAVANGTATVTAVSTRDPNVKATVDITVQDSVVITLKAQDDKKAVGKDVELTVNKADGEATYTYTDKGGYALSVFAVSNGATATLSGRTLTVKWDGTDADLNAIEVKIYCALQEENYQGDITTTPVVPDDPVAVTVKAVTDDGVTVAAPHTENVTKATGTYTYTLTEKAGYDLSLGTVTGGTATLSGNTVTVTWGESATVVDVIVIYTPKTVEYTVTHVYAGLNGADASSESETLSGRVGESTEAEAKNVTGFTADDFDQKQIAYDANNNITINYTRNTYKLTYNSMGGSYIPGKAGEYEEVLHAYTYTPAVPGSSTLTCTKEEHEHTASPSSNAGNNKNRGTTVGCYTSTEHWFMASYWTWDLSCGKEAHTHNNSCYTTTTGTPAGYNPMPTKQGYSFEGWYLDEECETAAPVDITLNGNVTLYAKWKSNIVNYTVVYYKEKWDSNTNTGYYTFASSETKTAEVGSTVTASKGSGYDYYTHDHVEEAVVKADGSTVVASYWNLTRYTLVFNLNDSSYNTEAKITANGTDYTGSDYKIENVVLGMDVSALWPSGDSSRPVVITGPKYGNTQYYYRKWGDSYASHRFEVTTDMLEDSGENESKSGTTITYYATWSSNPSHVNVEYWLQDENGQYYVKDETLSQNDVPASSLSAKEIYGFTVISGKPEGKQANGQNYPEAGNGKDSGTARYYYKRDSFSVSYYYKDTELTSLNKTGIPFGKDIAYLNVTPSRPAGVDSEATFAGWYDNADCNGDPYAFTTMPGSNLALYAKWQPKNKTVTLVYENGDENGSVTVEKGSTVESIPTPVKTGYAFDGWYYEDGTEFDISAPIMVDTTITARWSANSTTTYTIKYIYADGSEAHASETHDGKIGKTVTAKAITITTVDGKECAVDKISDSLELQADETKNIITFTYSKDSIRRYIVQYIYGDEVILERKDKTNEDGWFETESSSLAVEAEELEQLQLKGYSLVDGEATKKTVKPTADGIVVTFRVELTAYVISYVSKPLSSTMGTDYPDDNAVKGSNVTSYHAGDKFTITAPTVESGKWEIDHWELSSSKGTETIYSPELMLGKDTIGNFTITAYWDLKIVPYTVRYFTEDLEPDADGNPTYTQYGSDVAMSGIVNSRTEAVALVSAPEGFTLITPIEQKPIEGSGKTVVNVYYSRNSYPLTVHYVYAADNSEAKPDATDTVRYGAAYSVTSPEIEGFTADKAVVSGTMGTSAVEETVKYSQGKITFTLSTSSITEGQDAVFTVTTDKTLRTAATVTVTIGGKDYTCTVPAAGTTGTVTVEVPNAEDVYIM